MKYIDDYESARWKIIKSHLKPGVLIYDKLLEKVSVDIATGNMQIDEYITKAAYLCMHDSEFLNHVINYQKED